MTQKELAKKLKVPSYHAENKWWDLIEVKRLLKLINRIEAKVISSNPDVSGSSFSPTVTTKKEGYYSDNWGTYYLDSNGKKHLR